MMRKFLSGFWQIIPAGATPKERAKYYNGDTVWQVTFANGDCVIVTGNGYVRNYRKAGYWTDVPACFNTSKRS
jgi:hypothetical protein